MGRGGTRPYHVSVRMTSTSSHYFAFRFKNVVEGELKWDAVEHVLTMCLGRGFHVVPLFRLSF